MQAVAAEEKSVVERDRLRGIIEPYFGFDFERAVENVLAARRVAHVVRRQTGETVAAEPIGAPIADVQHMHRAPAQHQRGKGAAHAREI